MAQKLCCGSPLCTRPLKPSMVVLPRSARCRASTEADPLGKRIRTSACTAHRDHLPQLLTARLHVVQTVRPAERQPQSFRCDFCLATRADAALCDDCSTLDREGTGGKSSTRPSTRRARGHERPLRPWNGQPAAAIVPGGIFGATKWPYEYRTAYTTGSGTPGALSRCWFDDYN